LWIVGAFIGPLVVQTMFKQGLELLQPIEDDGSAVGSGPLVEAPERPNVDSLPLAGAGPLQGSSLLQDGLGLLQGAPGPLQGSLPDLTVGPLQGMAPFIAMGPIGFGPGWLVLPTSAPFALTEIEPPPEPSVMDPTFPASGPFTDSPPQPPLPPAQPPQISTPSGSDSTQISPAAPLTSSTSSASGSGSTVIAPTLVCVSGCGASNVLPVSKSTCQALVSGCN
jgi:hypothetical protein